MKKILVTEDDPGLQEIYKIILEKAGYMVTILPSGRDILNNHYQLPDLFVLDKQLSGMDGLDICKYLKSQQATKNVPVIIISATTDIQNLVKEAGADAFIEKPFDKKHLLQVVAENIAKNDNQLTISPFFQ